MSWAHRQTVLETWLCPTVGCEIEVRARSASAVAHPCAAKDSVKRPTVYLKRTDT